MKKSVGDTATNQDLSTAAKWIIDDCVYRDEIRKGLDSVGGYALYIGDLCTFVSPGFESVT